MSMYSDNDGDKSCPNRAATSAIVDSSTGRW
jgi:hypothetical protein